MWAMLPGNGSTTKMARRNVHPLHSVRKMLPIPEKSSGSRKGQNQGRRARPIKRAFKVKVKVEIFLFLPTASPIGCFKFGANILANNMAKRGKIGKIETKTPKKTKARRRGLRTLVEIQWPQNILPEHALALTAQQSTAIS